MSAPTIEYGHFFEDFSVGCKVRHATPRTLSSGDASLFIALTGARQPLFCATPFARTLGHTRMPIDDLLVFNMAFGKTVPDISFNAVANLGYADVRFLAPVYEGDTLSVETEVIGTKLSSSGDRGVVYVRSVASNQDGKGVLTWCRWVLVHARTKFERTGDGIVPELPKVVDPSRFIVSEPAVEASQVASITGSAQIWDDFEAGTRINHPAGMTLDESDHVFATRLYQNNARVHFDAMMMSGTPHGRRLVYGGHIISMCRALSYDGLENALRILSINGGTHAAPTFAGDTIYCFSEVVERIALPTRSDLGALRLRTYGLRNLHCAGLPGDELRGENGRLHASVVLELDYTVLMPRRGHTS